MKQIDFDKILTSKVFMIYSIIQLIIAIGFGAMGPILVMYGEDLMGAIFSGVSTITFTFDKAFRELIMQKASNSPPAVITKTQQPTLKEDIQNTYGTLTQKPVVSNEQKELTNK